MQQGGGGEEGREKRTFMDEEASHLAGHTSAPVPLPFTAPEASDPGRPGLPERDPEWCRHVTQQHILPPSIPSPPSPLPHPSLKHPLTSLTPPPLIILPLDHLSPQITLPETHHVKMFISLESQQLVYSSGTVP